jgi:hypothetical protein
LWTEQELSLSMIAAARAARSLPSQAGSPLRPSATQLGTRELDHEEAIIIGLKYSSRGESQFGSIGATPPTMLV